MTPGTRVYLEGTPWPERNGHMGVVVDPAIFDGKYPAEKPLPGFRIVLLDDDPLSGPDPDPRWSCVVSLSDLRDEPPAVQPPEDWSAVAVGGYLPDISRDQNGRWCVSLPHQCEEWVIAASTDKAFVLRETERFIVLLRSKMAPLRDP